MRRMLRRNLEHKQRGEHMRRYLVGLAFAIAIGAMTFGVFAAGLEGGMPVGVQAAPAAGTQIPGPGGIGARGQRGAPAGPPAPVPPEVTMQRPTADELAKINAALKRFVETNTSPDSA